MPAAPVTSSALPCSAASARAVLSKAISASRPTSVEPPIPSSFCPWPTYRKHRGHLSHFRAGAYLIGWPPDVSRLIRLVDLLFQSDYDAFRPAGVGKPLRVLVLHN